jgi:ornithine carbamoyltransferase
MSADAINISGSSSSTSKGETTLDTARNLMAMKPDVIVVRHSAAGAPALISRHVDAAVVNAGDGTHEHPTQALLDCATIRRHKGKVAGLEVAIVGDIDHSRVARRTRSRWPSSGAPGQAVRAAHADAARHRRGRRRVGARGAGAGGLHASTPRSTEPTWS